MSASTVIANASDALKNSDYPAVRRLSVERAEGSLILSGKVSSYFLKQIAQETVMAIRGPFKVVNRVDVAQRG